MRRLRRLPISTRIGVGCAGMFLLLLTAVDAIVYLQLGTALRAGIDQTLADQSALLAQQLGTGAVDLADTDLRVAGMRPSERITLLMTADGDILHASGELDDETRLLDRAAAREVATGGSLLTDVGVADSDYRVLAVPVRGASPVAVAVIAADLDVVTSAQQALLRSFGLVGMTAVLLASGAGWVVARRGLAPLERMAAEVSVITAGALDHRLPVPDSGDEVARLGGTVNTMLDRLSAAIQRERAFTADASHELRTPLAILRTSVELARNNAATDDARQLLDGAVEEADRLTALVNDLLVLARADADRLDSRERVDLGDLAADITGRFQVLAQQRGIVLTHEGAAAVAGDRRGLERGLANLVDNAVRHTPDGGQVEVRCAPDGRGAIITVTDTGPGVEAALLGRLFERFARADPSRPRGGAGLGLAIVAAVAGAHGGRVQAANRAEGGLEVRMWLR